MPTLCDRGRRSLSRRSPSSSWLWRLPTRWRALRGNTVRPLIIFAFTVPSAFDGHKPGRGRTQRAAAYLRAKSRWTISRAATQKGIGACHLTSAWVARPGPSASRRPRRHVRPARLASGGVPRRVRCGSAATNRHTGIGSLLAGQSDAALAPISRGVQRRDRLERAARSLQIAAVEGTGGARRKGYAPSAPRTTG